jgi:polysaccharide export outer membrane protein
MVFTLDLTTADGLFSAGEFPIHNKDLVLVSVSPISGTQTILDLLGDAAGISNDLDL